MGRDQLSEKAILQERRRVCDRTLKNTEERGRWKRPPEGAGQRAGPRVCSVIAAVGEGGLMGNETAGASAGGEERACAHLASLVTCPAQAAGRAGVKGGRCCSGRRRNAAGEGLG